MYGRVRHDLHVFLILAISSSFQIMRLPRPVILASRQERYYNFRDGRTTEQRLLKDECFNDERQASNNLNDEVARCGCVTSRGQGQEATNYVPRHSTGAMREFVETSQRSAWSGQKFARTGEMEYRAETRIWERLLWPG